MGPSDWLLVRRLRRGDRDACRDLIDRFHAQVYGYLRRLGAGAASADELTQETYARAWTRIDTLRQAGSLRSWLLTIARNEFLQDARRKRPVEIGIEAADRIASDDQPADVVAARAERETGLRRALGGLDAGLLEAIDLHYYRGLSLKETAGVLGVPTGTAKSRINRALVVLRDLLDKEATHAGPKAEQATANGA